MTRTACTRACSLPRCTPASSPFEYAAKLTEVMLLGVVALRAGRKIEYDGAAMRVTNVPAANEFLQRTPRTGW